MKRNFILIALAALLHGCSSDISGMVEGVKWADNFSKLDDQQAYTSFIDGKVMSCVKSKGTWEAVTTYKINGNKLAIPADKKAGDTKLFELSIQGSGDAKVLIMTRRTGEKVHEMAFPISNTADCPMPK